jgi:hypothetical protein
LNNILTAAAVVGLCGCAGIAESVQAPDVDAIVEQFVPYAALGLARGDLERVSVCHRVLQQDAGGQPLAIAALYLARFEGRLRILVQSGGTFRVADESAGDLELTGSSCALSYEDLDGDGAADLAAKVSRGLNDELWLFTWSNGDLENVTPTIDEDAGVATLFDGAIIVDVAHDGKKQVYAETRRVEPAGPDDEPGSLYVKQDTGWIEDPECRDLWFVRYGGLAGPPHEIRGASVTGQYFLKLVNGAAGGGQRATVTSVKVGGVEVLAPGTLGVGNEFVEIPLGTEVTSGQLVEVISAAATPDALLTAILLKR